MAWNQYTGGFGEDEDEMVEESKNTSEAVIFLVDCHPKMFQNDSGGKIPFLFCIETIANFYSQKIINDENALLSVIFFGTEKSSNKFKFENIFVLQDLDLNSAEKIKQIEAFKDPEISKRFIKDFGMSQKEGMNIHDLFWTSQHLFSTVKKKALGKRIFLFTNRENPIPFEDESLRKKTNDRCNEMILSGIGFFIFIFPTAENEQFDTSKFWKEIEELDPEGESVYIKTDCYEYLGEAFSGDSIKKKFYPKRAISSLDFLISKDPDISLSVKLYNLVQPAKKALAQKLNAKDNKKVKSERKFICSDTASELDSGDILQTYDYGGKQIFFTPDEIKKIKNVNDTVTEKGIVLIGFKPYEMLEDYHQMKPSSFIYPDDTKYKGSTNAFAALYLKMIELKKMAICRYKLRDNLMPTYVALVPDVLVGYEEGLDEEDYTNGLHMFYIPFASGIRELEFNETDEDDRPTLEEETLTKKLIEDLTLKEYTPQIFQNPSLQTHYSTLKALALQQEIQPIEDTTKPKEELFEEHKDTIMNFRNHFFGDEPVKKEKKKKKRKRVKSEGDGAPKKKRRKTKDSDSDEVEIDVVDLAKNGELNTLTAPTLKDFLRQYKLKLSGKKQVLIDRITEYLKRRGKI